MKLKEIRKKAKKSQLEVAKAIGISQQNLCRYENEQYQPDIQLLIKLAKYYDVSLDYLCESPSENYIGYIPDNRKELVKEIIELSDADAKEVQIFLKGYKAGKSGTSEFSIFN